MTPDVGGDKFQSLRKSRLVVPIGSADSVESPEHSRGTMERYDFAACREIMIRGALSATALNLTRAVIHMATPFRRPAYKLQRVLTQGSTS